MIPHTLEVLFMLKELRLLLSFWIYGVELQL